MALIDLDNMVLKDIDVDSITNSGGTGVFDKLMSSVNDNINTQYDDGRINSNDYATVYLGSLQAVLAQSIQFSLQEQLTEVQIANAIADSTLKAKQLEISTIDQSIKQFELDSTLPEELRKTQEEINILQTQDSEMLLNGVKDRLLKDAQNSDVLVKTAIATSESSKNVLLKQEQIESEALNNADDGVIANQILDIKKGVDIKERQMTEAELTGVKQRLVLDEEVESANLQQVILATEEEIKTAQKLEIEDSTSRANTQLSDSILTSTSQRSGIVVDTASKQYELDNILPEQLEKVKEDAAILYTARVEKDKQAAKLGLDNVMKTSEASKDTEANFVYTPKYNKG